MILKREYFGKHDPEEILFLLEKLRVEVIKIGYGKKLDIRYIEVGQGYTSIVRSYLEHYLTK